MVQTQRLNISRGQAVSSAGTFDCSESSKAPKFWLFLKGTATKDEKKENAINLLMDHLKGRAFDVFYDSFCEDRQLTEKGEHYKKAKNMFKNKFAKEYCQED